MKKIFYTALICSVMCFVSSCINNNGSITDNGSADSGSNDGRKIIKLTALENNQTLENYVRSFNSKSKEYKVEVRVFAQDPVPGETYSYENDITNLNAEIISGEIPDIISDTGSLLPVDSYIRKGLICDLYTLMESDRTFIKEDYLQSVFKASEHNGRLYEVFPAFTVRTVYAKTSETGNITGWTLDEFADFISEKPDSSLIISGLTKNDFVTMTSAGLFSEANSGNYRFERNELDKLLKIAERFPSEYPQGYNNFTIDTGMSAGNPIMCFNILSNPRQIREWEKLNAGEEISFPGMPQSNRNEILPGYGSSFFPDIKILITNKAEEKQGAWEFVKSVLNEKPVNSGLSIPVKLSFIEDMLKKAKENPPESGGEEYFTYQITESSEWIKVPIGNNNEEDNNKFMNFIESVNHVYNPDFEIERIIGEEAGAYFSGLKPADEVSGIIETRINIYIEETYN